MTVQYGASQCDLRQHAGPISVRNARRQDFAYCALQNAKSGSGDPRGLGEGKRRIRGKWGYSGAFRGQNALQHRAARCHAHIRLENQIGRIWVEKGNGAQRNCPDPYPPNFTYISAAYTLRATPPLFFYRMFPPRSCASRNPQ